MMQLVICQCPMCHDIDRWSAARFPSANVFIVCRGPRAEPPIERSWFYDKDLAFEEATALVAQDGGDREIWAADLDGSRAVGTKPLRRVVSD